MKQLLSIIALLFLVSISCFAQSDSVLVTVRNQYESEIKNAAITVVRTGDTATTNDHGLVTIKATTGDEITISKDNYDTTDITIQNIKGEVSAIAHKQFTWKDLITPMFYIINGGLWMMLLIIFAETGLFIGFFFPGDSLLFVAGIFSDKLAASVFDTGNVYLNLLLIIALTTAAGILGNTTGYIFGKSIGKTMFQWKDNILFKKKYLYQAQDFYDKHGGGAIVFARFVPIIRTFAPIVAGIVEMDKKKFAFYNIMGCILWVASMILGGHFLQQWILKQFNFDLKQHLEIIVIGIVLVTTAPVIIKLVFGKVTAAKHTNNI
ncbi:MAG: VTT domain-containing protein [Deinococcales bacterium]|nr:VTT domain-containing protein [Chitinophagaceae bacterium]